MRYAFHYPLRIAKVSSEKDRNDGARACEKRLGGRPKGDLKVGKRGGGGIWMLERREDEGIWRLGGRGWGNLEVGNNGR